MEEKKRIHILSDAPALSFLKDERTIFEELGVSVGFPLRVFNLEGIKIRREPFICDLAPTFQALTWDEYDRERDQLYFLLGCFPGEANHFVAYEKSVGSKRSLKNEFAELIDCLSSAKKIEFEKIKPYRRRAIGKFLLQKYTKRIWRIERLPAGEFSQDVESNDYRSSKRVFHEMSPAVSDHPEFRKLLVRLGEIIEGIHKHPERLLIIAHQVGIVARHGRFGDNAPEGIHQDGVDYIVSALVMERNNIEGGRSNVYGFDKKTLYLSRELGVGEGIFQTDRGSPFWHDVTPISLCHANPYNSLGERTIFGFDITVI